LILIYFTFRSIKPFLFAATSIVIGFVVAFAATHAVFGEVHLLTIIFGTSLVGVSDDYSLHFFSEYLNHKNKNKNTGDKVLKHIFPGITMGLITSILGYMSLMFTPFPGLQQIAFFSTIGFTVSYLIVVLFFPKFYQPSKLVYRSTLLDLSNKFLTFFQKIISRKKY
jgi:predicted exporter